MDNVEILIVHLDGEKIISDCLESIYRDNRSARVSILFNRTLDDSAKVVKKKFPAVKQYYSKKLIGFAEASNFLALKSRAKYILFLNNDTIVHANWVKEMLNTIIKNPNCTACQPKILSFSNRSYFEYAGAGGGFIDKYGYPFCRGRIFNKIEMDKGQYDDERRIFWGCGVCLMIERETFLKLEGFDNRFFMYGEEIDLCWRINKIGKEIWFCPNASIQHIGSYSIKKEKINFKKERLITQNHLLIFLKNYSSLSIIKLLPGRIFLEIIAAVVFPTKKALPLIYSLFSVPYIYITDSIKKKNSLKNLVVKNDDDLKPLIYPGSIALQHYLGGKKTISELKWLK